MDYFNYNRRKSSEVQIGNTPLGANHPIRIQSMTNTSTLDTNASVEQCIRIIEAGGDYVRLTAQGEREAENLSAIKELLVAKGYHTPLVADIHFNPRAADVAAKYVEKVRINPGNFVDSARTFKQLNYTDGEYSEEIKKIRTRFIPFLEICKAHKTAIRIGVNHGSLSDRIMSRYGDTPEGMVESCMEFLRICREKDFSNVVISIKASNTLIMVKTVRLLVRTMDQENMNFPLHLGVTEAGDGEDGRIKSAVGIGTLLADGIGDTIRVSLSEDPEIEIPVAKKLVEYISQRENHEHVSCEYFSGHDYYNASKRNIREIENIGGKHVPVVISYRKGDDLQFDKELFPDYIYISNQDTHPYRDNQRLIVDQEHYKGLKNTFPLFTAYQVDLVKQTDASLKFIELDYHSLNNEILEILQNDKKTVVILKTGHINPVAEQRAFFHKLLSVGCDIPVILKQTYKTDDPELLQLMASADFGAMLLDFFGEGIMIENQGNIPQQKIDNYMFGILQASRQRTSKTEYISCPGCGRTLFDLQTTIARVKKATGHLKGLKIGIMGCIVNGPGEMADADYGYVGAQRNKISLYKGKQCIEKNIPEENAVEKLIELIKLNGDWQD